MLSQTEAAALTALARDLHGVDVDCYRRHGRDPAQPLVGLGPRTAPLCLVGRDPGDKEVELWRPFVGASGRKLRDALAARGAEEHVFWINTVPYKPQGNKAWPLAVRRRFHAVLFPVLLRHWAGRDVVTLGSEAFHWFGLDQPEAARRALQDFWALEDKFEESLEVDLVCGRQHRSFVLHPLPHPSPANAQWKKRFPELLQRRLERLLPGERLVRNGVAPPAQGRRPP
jgi:uracil-DNA glycosylase family 4